MAFPTWTPPRPPHIGSSLSVDQRVLEAAFGDGYMQIVADGLNAGVDSVTLSWDGLDSDDLDEILTTIRLYGRATPFLYTLPWDVSPKLWRFSGAATISTPVQSRYGVSVPIKQAFDLA